MASAVYLLCAVTSLTCAGLLIRGFLNTRTRLLLWSSFCFVGLTVNNLLLFVDLIIVPEIDLSLYRAGTALLSFLLLLDGLIWNRE